MLSVPLPASEVRDLLGDELDMASVNAPELCVVSGPQDGLDRLDALLRSRELEPQRIQIDIAAHSRMLEPILGRFEAYLRSIRLSAPKIPIISNRDGQVLSAGDATDPMYWVRHLRNTVHFRRLPGHPQVGGPPVFIWRSARARRWVRWRRPTAFRPTR